MQASKKTMVACIIGVCLYLCLTLLLIGQTSCSGWQPPETLYPQKILACTMIARDCTDKIKAAHEAGELDQIAIISAQCVLDWEGGDCSKMIADTIESIPKDVDK